MRSSFTALGFPCLGLIGFARLIDMRNFSRHDATAIQSAGLVQTFDEIDTQRMDGDGAGVESQRAIRIGLNRQGFGQIAVFDHLYHTVGHYKVADFFQRVGFGDDVLEDISLPAPMSCRPMKSGSMM